MKIWCYFFIVLTMLITAGNAVGASADKKATEQKGGRERLAVLDLEAKYGVEKAFAAGLSVIVRDAIHSYGQYVVMSQEDIRAVATREQLMQAVGCDDGSSECLLDFGRAIGTRFMVAGSISKFGTTYTVSLRMLDTKGKSAGLVNRVSEDCKCDEDGLIETVRNVSAGLIGKQLVAKEKTRFETTRLTDPKRVADEDEQKRIADNQEKTDLVAKKANAEAALKLADEKKKADEFEKQSQASIAEERRKTELDKQQFVAEVERWRKEKELAAAEAERNKLALEMRKTEEVERQRQAEEERLRLLAVTEKLKKEKALAEAERTRLIEEKKRVEEETARLLAEENNQKEKNKLKQLATAREQEGKGAGDGNGKETENIAQESHVAVVLRSKPIKVKEPELTKFINNYNFFEKGHNVSGSFENNFIDNGVTVTDKKTGLIWQKSGSSSRISYFRAKAYVKDLNSNKFGGFSDWRLPTLEELASLLEENTVNDMHVDRIFDSTQSRLWSSDIPDNYSGYDQYGTSYILNLEEGFFVRSIFVKESFSGEGTYSTNFENYARAVRTIESPL